MAPLLCAGISPLCPPHPCCCTLLRGSEASPLCHLQSPPAKGLPSVWKPFLLHSSLPLVQVPSLFFCLCYFFFLLPYPGTRGVSCLLGGLTSSASVQWVFYRSSSTCRCISDVSVGRKVISASYSLAIFPRPPMRLFLKQFSIIQALMITDPISLDNSANRGQIPFITICVSVYIHTATQRVVLPANICHGNQLHTLVALLCHYLLNI